MTGPSAHVQAAALRAAFPGYVVNVVTGWGDKPRFEVVARTASKDRTFRPGVIVYPRSPQNLYLQARPQTAPTASLLSRWVRIKSTRPG